MNVLIDVVSEVYANIFMYLLGDARLAVTTLMSAVCVSVILLGLAVGLSLLFRSPPSSPPPPSPGTTVIVQQFTPALLMVFVVILVFVYLAR